MRFAPEPINAPGSYGILPDPTGAAPTRRVHNFQISPDACSSRKYDNGNSHCTFRSVRAQAYETNMKQPQEAWYGWYMYLAPDFPLGKAQRAGGAYSLAY